MKIHLSPRNGLALIGAAVSLFPALIAAASEPPTPTPRPDSLGAYARRVRLNPANAADSAGRIVISSATVADLSGRGRITLGAVSAPRTATPPAIAKPAAAIRARWRTRYLAQKKVVLKLEHRRLRLEAEIDLLEGGRLTPLVLARMEQKAIEIRALESEIETEKSELWRIVREARHEGAEPGWFR